MIHNILILKKTGENLFSKTFGEGTWNDTLTSGFISAAFSFTQINFKAGIQELEIGAYRLFFESGENFIITAFFNTSDSIINVRQKLRKLREIISTTYGHLISKMRLFGVSIDLETLLSIYELKVNLLKWK